MAFTVKGHSKTLGRQANTLHNMRKALEKLPETVAQRVAQRSATALTAKAQAAYDGGRNVYGEARKRGEDGQELDLVETTTVRRHVKFEANGRVLRAVLPTRYAPYLVGKFRVLPMGEMPNDWAKTIEKIADEEIQAAVTEGINLGK